MASLITLNDSECSHCYKCIRNCPVKAIRFASNQATIIEQECVLCGRCFVACPQKAKSIQDDSATALALLQSGRQVIASLAPSFIANFPGVGIDGITKAMLQLGFSEVQETAIGAAVVKANYDEMADKQEKDVIISSCCPTVNLLIQKHYPAAIPYTAGLLSPMLTHATIIKQQTPEAAVIFIGPCISKKEEAAHHPDLIDCALTFHDLQQLFAAQGITPPLLEKLHSGARTRLFPVAGGVLRTMAKSNPNYSYMAVDGIENCIAALNDVVKGFVSHCFIEMSACSGSCIGGPLMGDAHSLVHNYAAVDISSGSFEYPLHTVSREKLQKAIPVTTSPRAHFSPEAIEGVLRSIGKTKPEDELNCGSCGYDTCREKAKAVLQGKADLTMCLPYLMSKARSFSDTIINNTPNAIFVLNRDLIIQQINATAMRLFNLRGNSDVTGCNVLSLMNPTPFIDVLESGEGSPEKMLFLPEYDKYVMLTIVLDESSELLIAIFRDVTQMQLERRRITQRNRRTVDITDKVIEKQMKTVQEIASLLGETAAETKIALTKLKETLDED